jgi:hypothetical protein
VGTKSLIRDEEVQMSIVERIVSHNLFLPEFEYLGWNEIFLLYYIFHLTESSRRGTRVGYLWESHREKDQWEDQDEGGWIILGWILERWDGLMWTGLVWLRIGTGGELL